MEVGFPFFRLVALASIVVETYENIYILHHILPPEKP